MYSIAAKAIFHTGLQQQQRKRQEKPVFIYSINGLNHNRIENLIIISIERFSMGYLNSIGHMIGEADLFYSSELLRFKGDTEYKTFTGGIISISLVAMVIAGFLSMISETLNKTAISSTLSEYKSSDPPFYNLTTDPKSNFMFGILIQPKDMSFNVDLNNGPRYFDVSLLVYSVQYSVVNNITGVPLVACTDDHWSMMPEMIERADLYDYKSWLCPKIGQTLPLQGSFSSAQFYQAVINVAPCNNSTDPNRPCAPQSQIDQLFDKYQNFYVVTNYVNTVVNPSQTQYLSYYLQANDFVTFSKTQGSQAGFFISDFTVSTDTSFWPFSTYQTDIGTTILNKAINHPFTASQQSGYVLISFSKDLNSLVYQRQVQKISAVFSYIGGLVGAISALLFFLKAYTKISLQMNIAMKLFTEQRKIEVTMKHIQSVQQIKQKQSMKDKMRSFNFLSFMYLLFYKCFSLLRCKLNWKAAKVYERYQQQVFNQLDVTTLIKRVIALENCLSFMLEEHQIQGLRHGKKMNCERAKELRQMLMEKVDQQTKSVEKQQAYMQSSGNQIANIAKIEIADDLTSPVQIVQFKKNKSTSIKLRPNKIGDTNKRKDQGTVAKKDLVKLQAWNQGKQDQNLNYQNLQNLAFLLQQAKQNSLDRKIWDNLQDQIKLRIENSDEASSTLKSGQKQHNKPEYDLLIESNFEVSSAKG